MGDITTPPAPLAPPLPSPASLPLPPRAYATLLTRPSYLPGALLLSYSLQKVHSRYPLLILYTPSLFSQASSSASPASHPSHSTTTTTNPAPAPALTPSTLAHECALTNALPVAVSPLFPSPASAASTPAKPLIASRFADTFTKLRVFELTQCERVVFLDADMLVRRNIDALFEMELPGVGPESARDDSSDDGGRRNGGTALAPPSRPYTGPGILANHACVCNLDHDSWAPPSWTAPNCAYTSLSATDVRRVPSPAAVAAGRGKATHTLLNGGMFVLAPSAALWAGMMAFWEGEQERIRGYMFPDQDLLADFFEGGWRSVGWEWNGIKTMRYWHGGMWTDEGVRVVHYIVDKPWNERVKWQVREVEEEKGGKKEVERVPVAGYLRRDGVTHDWWWREYELWEKEREEMGQKEILEMMREVVAPPLIEGEEKEGK